MAIPSAQIAAAIPAPGPNGSLNIQISETHPVPKPANGEVLIKLEYSGVCHSDVHSIRGDTPMLTDVAGHEGVGKVVAGEGSQGRVSVWKSIFLVSNMLISIIHFN
jgi:propanol-preferring alcohol dehydrogenase